MPADAKQPKHPMQPVYRDGDYITRFKNNAIVRHLLDNGPWDMNALASLHFSAEDRRQFAQLIGYSVSGYCELPYVRDEDADAALNAAQELLDREKRGE